MEGILLEKKMKLENEKALLFELLTDELVAEILIRVPVKSLYRSRCVCKRWRFLTSEPIFFKSFVSRTMSLPPLISGFFCNTTIENRPPVEVKFLAFTNNELHFTDVIDSSLGFLLRPVLAVASHNGLLLCLEFLSWDYVACNPFYKQWSQLPRPKFPFRFPEHTILICNHGEQFTDFMVICLSKVQQDVIVSDVYSSESREWKRSEITHQLGTFNPRKNYVLPDGSIFLWDVDHRYLCLYDLEGETLYPFDLPACHISSIPYMGIAAGSLYYVEADATHFYVWVLVDGVDWFLEHSVKYGSLVDEILEVPVSDHLSCSLAFHPSNLEVLLLRIENLKEGTVKGLLYHMDTGEVEFIHKIDANFSFSYVVFPYLLPAWMSCLRNSLNAL